MGPRDKTDVIGWREWVALPDLGVRRIKAKVDTGARTSALHAWDVEAFRRRGSSWIRFALHPRQRTRDEVIHAEAELVEYRRVRSSSGESEERPVIRTRVEILGQSHPVEITLTRRDTMGFRMLLGRQAVRDAFLVDPGRSYYGGRPKRKKKKKKTKTKKTRSETTRRSS